MNAFSLKKELPTHGGLALPLAPHRARASIKRSRDLCRVLIVTEEKTGQGDQEKVVSSRTPEAHHATTFPTRSIIFLRNNRVTKIVRQSPFDAAHDDPRLLRKTL